MRKIYLLLLLVLPLIAFACNRDKNKGKAAVCITDNVALRAKPEKTGELITTISMGESGTYLGETKDDKTSGNVVNYVKIKLKDGKEGWALSNYVIIGLRPAAILEDNTVVFSRPNLLNKTAKTFSKMDIVAVKSEQDGFLEIEGKHRGLKSVQTGWIKNTAVTSADVDIAVATFANKALKINNSKKREEAFKEITQNPDLQGSIFLSDFVKNNEPPVEATIAVPDSLTE